MNFEESKRRWLGNVVPVATTEAAAIYWTTDIPVGEIIEVYAPHLHPNQISSLVGAAYSPFVCASCDDPVAVTSRSSAQDVFATERKACTGRWKYDRRLLCAPCQQAEQDRRTAPFREEMRLREARERELRTMPYREYLLTQEWAAKRAEAVRRARYCCQACASNGRLHVHHRTYVRRGAEYASDLIALCADCHRVFHERRSLADAGRATTFSSRQPTPSEERTAPEAA